MYARVLSIVASFAFFVAMNSVNTTCLFLTYQPEVPEELR